MEMSGLRWKNYESWSKRRTNEPKSHGMKKKLSEIMPRSKLGRNYRKHTHKPAKNIKP